MVSLLAEYEVEHNRNAVPVTLGPYETKGVLLDRVTERDTRTPGSDLSRLEPGVSELCRIVRGNWPAEWPTTEGALRALLQPLNLSVSEVTYRTDGVRVKFIFAQPAYVDVLLAPLEFNAHEEAQMFRFADWQRIRRVQVGVRPDTRAPIFETQTETVQLELHRSGGDATGDFSRTTAHVFAHAGTLRPSDIVRRNGESYVVLSVLPQERYERAELALG